MEIEDYNAMIDGRKLFGQPVNKEWINNNTSKISNGRRDN